MTIDTSPVIVNGKTYIAIEQTKAGRFCAGCVGHNDSALCGALPYCSGDNFENAIFIEVPDPVSTPDRLRSSASYHLGYEDGMAAKQAEWKAYEASRKDIAATYAARPTDPVTSHKAAEGMKRRAVRISDLVLTSLLFDNMTGKQLAAVTGVALNSITPRFAQLTRRGLIHPVNSHGRETVWALGNGIAAAPVVSPSLFESI